MMVRCGACRTEFDVAGAGRHACPTCGAINQVAEAPQASPQASAPQTPPGAFPGAQPGQEEAAGPSAPEPTRARCSQCDFEFFVGDIDVAECPNCGTEVKVDAK